MSAVMSEVNAANDDYYLTPAKARDKRRIASVKARNAANARIFIIGGVGMTVKEIAAQINSTPSTVSKEIKLLRKRGVRRFTLDDFPRKAANDEHGEQDESHRVSATDPSAGA